VSTKKSSPASAKNEPPSLARERQICRGRIYKPNSVRRFPGGMIIPLGRALLRGSSDLPESSNAPSRLVRSRRLSERPGTRRLPRGPFPSYLVLLRVGFAMPHPSLNGRCALTAPFHPYHALRRSAVCSLWHFPSATLDGDAPGRYPAHCSTEFGLSSLAPVRSGWAGGKRSKSDHPIRLRTVPLYRRLSRRKVVKALLPPEWQLFQYSVARRFGPVAHMPLLK